MKTQTKILIVEHDSNDIDLIRHELKKGNVNYIAQVVQTENGYENALLNFKPDIILSDYTLPSFSGLEAFKMKEEITPGTPFIFVSGTIGEDNSLELINSGVTDFTLKERLFTLANKVNRALKNAKAEKEKSATERALQQSESRLARAQQIAHVGSWELDFATGMALWSEESCRIYGLDAGDNRHSFNDWVSFIHPADVDRIMKLIKEERKTLTSSSFYHRIIRKDGTIRHIHTESRFEFDSNSKPTGLYGIAHDITEAKEMEEGLRKSEANLAAVFKTTDIGFLFADLDYNIIATNDCMQDWAKTFLGAIHENGKNLKETLSPERFANFEQMAVEVKQGQQFTKEYYETGADGAVSWFNVNCKPVKGDNNEVIGICLAQNNITEKKLAETQLAFDKSNTDALINNTRDFMWSVDKDFKLLTFNQPFNDLLQHYTDKGLEKGLDILSATFSPGRVATFKKYYERAFTGEAFSEIEYSDEPAGHWVESSFYPIRDGNKVIGVACNSRNITEKKLAEAQLAFDKSNMDALINNTLDFMWSIDRDFKLITFNRPFNDQMQQYTGKGLEKGLNILSAAFTPEQVATYKNHYERAFAGEAFSEIEYTNAPAEYWVEVSFYPIRDGDNVIGVACNSRDITEKRKAESALRKSEALYRSLFENMLNGFSYCRMYYDDAGKPVDFRYISVNDAFEKQTGLLNVTGKLVSEAIPGVRESNPEMMNIYGRVASTGNPEEFEMFIDALQDWYSLSVYSPEPGYFVAVFDVITERKQAEARREFDRSNLDALINNTNDSMWSVDRDYKLITYNQPMYEIIKSSFGREIKQGESMLTYAFTPRQANTYKKFYERAFAGEAFTEIEYTSSSFEIWSEVSFCPIREGDKIIGAACHLRDVTERVKAENTIKELNETLEERVQQRTAELTEANKALEAFSSTVSHDLRAPVRAINSFSHILRQELHDKMTPEQIELFKYIQDSGKRMSAIIDDLLKLAKYGSGKLKLEPVNMTRLVNGIWLNISRTMPHHAALELAELPTVEVDMSMIQQVVVNLLSNAIKYSSKKHRPIIEVWAEQTPESVTFYFKDNGAGFDMEKYHRLFGAFQRLHTSNEFEGTGVGLTLVKRIIEKHGGTVGAEAKVGEGATFSFTLPLPLLSRK